MGQVPLAQVYPARSADFVVPLGSSERCSAGLSARVRYGVAGSACVSAKWKSTAAASIGAPAFERTSSSSRGSQSPMSEISTMTNAGTNTWNAALVPNDEDLPAILDRVYPCHEIVKIDAYLPGCPPHPELLWQALSAIAAGRPLGTIDYRDFKFD